MHRKNLKIWASAATLCAVAGVSGAAIGLSGIMEAPAAATGSADAPYDLKCESLVRPIAVNTLSPRLSWKLPADWKSQSAYELQVGTDSLALAQGGATDLWATGKVESDKSVNVEYAGDALVAGIQAYWRVRLWNQDGTPSSWSEVSRFGVGYIDGNDMPGEFIAMGKGASGKEPMKYIMIPNRVYTGMANHRYNTEKYLQGIDYPVEYFGYSTVERIYWDSDNIDRVEIHLNVKTAADAEVGKDYRLEILSGDEGNHYIHYAQAMPPFYPYPTLDYSTNSDNRLFENGTFDSDDAGRYTPAGPYRPGDEDKFKADEIKTLGNSIHNRFSGSFSPITITAGSGGIDKVADDNDKTSVEYFDLKGIRVENPRHGIYVRRTGNKIEKVVIR